MAYQVPTSEPLDAVAGASWFWDIQYPQFPASEGWQLTYYIRGPEDFDTTWDTHVTASGDAFEVRIPATATDLTAGKYRMTGWVVLSGEKHAVYDGHLLVVANPATAVNAKSHARQMLEALEAAELTAASTSSTVRVRINGRETEYARDEYDRRLAKYRLLVAIEENPDGGIDHEAVFARG